MVCKKTLLELRDAWGFTLMQLRHVMELQYITNAEYDPVYLALEQAELLIRGIYLLIGVMYRLEDVDICIQAVSE